MVLASFFVWQIYHYDLKPNAALFAVKKACELIHIQFNEADNGTIQVINNLPTALVAPANNWTSTAP